MRGWMTAVSGRHRRRLLMVGLLAGVLAGCQLSGSGRLPLPLAAEVDLPRFMGDWYVIAAIPLPPERQAYNAVETYRLDEDGTVATRYRQRKGRFDAPVDVYEPRGFVEPGSGNALWGMQFIWPFKGEYRIAYVAPDYSATIIARSKRDYVWLMARTPVIAEADYARHLERIAAMGYDIGKLRRVPQRWPE